MSLPMTRLEIIGLKGDLSTAVSSLQALGIVHIEDITDCPDAAVAPLALTDADACRERDLEALLVRLDRLRCALATSGPTPTPGTGASLEDARAGCADLGPVAEELLARCREIEEETARLELRRSALASLAGAISEVPNGYRASYFSGGPGQFGSIDALAESLALAGTGVDVAWAPTTGSSVAVALIHSPDLATEVAEAARLAGLSPLGVPDSVADAAPQVVLDRLEAVATAASSERTEALERLRALSAQWYGSVAAWSSAVTDELECLRVRRRLGETSATFMLVGWVPRAEAFRVTETLESVLHGAVSVRELAVSAHDMLRAPVAMRNPRVARPFESLVRLVSLPGYGATDPTVLMAILLPVFSGMMLGDIGYGALLLALSLWLRTRVTGASARDLLSVLAIGAAWAIGFGFLYGELFGTLGAQMGLRPIWAERTDAAHMTSLLLAALAIGVLHVSLGLVLGILEAVRHHNRAHLLERGGMLVGLGACLALMGVAAGVVPRPLLPVAAGGIVLGVAMLAASIGWLGLLLGPIEFVGLIGNILSYLRIAAIGLASAMLALVANEVAGLLGNLVAGVAIALLIHAMNLVLGAFSPTVHSLRLHYVEFFRKFYEGGGSPYRPFRAVGPAPNTAGITGGTHGR